MAGNQGVGCGGISQGGELREGQGMGFKKSIAGSFRKVFVNVGVEEHFFTNAILGLRNYIGCESCFELVFDVVVRCDRGV